MDANQRLIELESKLTFQEATLETLNEVVIALGSKLEVLENRLEQLESRVVVGAGEGEEPDPLEERPPHY